MRKGQYFPRGQQNFHTSDNKAASLPRGPSAMGRDYFTCSVTQPEEEVNT